jgi:hypothetical protein
MPLTALSCGTLAVVAFIVVAVSPRTFTNAQGEIVDRGTLFAQASAAVVVAGAILAYSSSAAASSTLWSGPRDVTVPDGAPGRVNARLMHGRPHGGPS